MNYSQSWRFHTPCSVMNRISTQKICKIIRTEHRQPTLSENFGIFHPTTVEFFSSTHRTFTKMDHIPCHKINFNKFESIGIIQCMFSDCNGIKPEIISCKRNQKDIRTLNTYFRKKKEKFQTNNLSFFLKKLEKEQ